MNCSRSIRLHNEVFAAYFHKKINEGKPYNVAITHVAKKLVRLIFALETKGEMFDHDKLRWFFFLWIFCSHRGACFAIPFFLYL